MPKKIKFESFKYHFLRIVNSYNFDRSNKLNKTWNEFIKSLNFTTKNGVVTVEYTGDSNIFVDIDLKKFSFYERGDVFQEKNVNQSMHDPRSLNFENVTHLINHLVEISGFNLDQLNDSSDRHISESQFHDLWAEAESINEIDVLKLNQACTSPEMRFITQRLGNIKGKTVLDIGCGLGEASVYFAMLGANVTALDISPKMLEAANQLAIKNSVKVNTHLAAAEDFKIHDNSKFDIIYAGNLLHHVDIEQTLNRVTKHLSPHGIFVSWDPLAYNPAINYYRSIATEVRTIDEHPLTIGDIKTFEKYFNCIEKKYFWLTTLIIFIIMYCLQRRNPNQERYWKSVIKEENSWRWLYYPLEKIDEILLELLTPLRWLCWNIVILAKNANK